MIQETDYDRDDDPNALQNNESDSSDDEDDSNSNDDENNGDPWNNELVGPMANLDVAETDTED